ncbi:hypothetical protein H0N98_01840 [Candidatus Micrarchaeota archaeon]|nr:hypothetical protein [Candidatus Micrarchaeota archaeon]
MEELKKIDKVIGIGDKKFAEWLKTEFNIPEGTATTKALLYPPYKKELIMILKESMSPIGITLKAKNFLNLDSLESSAPRSWDAV